MALGTEHSGNLQLDQLLETVTHQLRDQLARPHAMEE